LESSGISRASLPIICRLSRQYVSRGRRKIAAVARGLLRARGGRLSRRAFLKCLR
jgi:hypothetical protein